MSTDTRLVDIFRRHGAKATFNLNAGLHEKPRRLDWIYQGTEVFFWKLGLDEMREVYSGFAIANHSLTHPHLDDMPSDAARLEIAEGRDRLEQFFGRRWPDSPIPLAPTMKPSCPRYETGHVHARTVQNVKASLPPS
ncbi:MAG: polysaccharide deacetylase family protein [Propionivibrio sp.]|nr:polysaccharide deacetylase family protein [Propionivibrio sp.]